MNNKNVFLLLRQLALALLLLLGTSSISSLEAADKQPDAAIATEVSATTENTRQARLDSLELEAQEQNPEADSIVKKDFADLSAYIGKLDNKTVREWYVYHVSRIHEKIAPEGTMEEKAHQAFTLRTTYMIQARDLMADQKARRKLDVISPPHTWEAFVQEKMQKKNLTREQAIEDIYNTAVKSNQRVNERLGVKE